MIAAITGNLWRLLAIALAVACVMLCVQLYGFPFFGVGALERAEIAETALNKIDNAQAQATTDQVVANNRPAQTSAIIAEVSNVQAPDYYDRVKRASVDSVRASNRCATSPADLPKTDSAAEVNDGNAEAADMVSVAATDYAEISGAAGQAAMCVRAGQALIATGVAVEGSE